MDCCVNEMSGCKEEEQHTNGSTTMAKDTLPLKIAGEERLEDKEEADDHNITPLMPQHP